MPKTIENSNEDEMQKTQTVDKDKVDKALKDKIKKANDKTVVHK